MLTRRCALILGLMATLHGTSAFAETYPARSVQYIVPFAPGGVADLIARLVTDGFSASLKQSFVLENRAGANGIVGTTTAIQAVADGYTLLQVTNGTLSINPALSKSVTYDAVRDLAHVGFIARQPYVIAVNSALPVTTLAELIALAKQKDGKLSFAASSAAQHLAAELFQKEAGIKLTHVAYNSSGLALPDVLSGRVDLMITSPLNVGPYVGKLVPIATTGANRSLLLPDVPTLKELGLEKLVVESWLGVSAPAGTPPEIIQRLNAVLNQHLRQPEVQAALAKAGFEASPQSPEEFTEFVREEVERDLRIVAESGIEKQ